MQNLKDAECVLQEIAKLTVRDDIRMQVSYVAAIILGYKGEYKRAANQFRNVLQEYAQLLALIEYKDLHEDICYRRAQALARSGKYKDAVDLLKEATLFSTFSAESRQDVHAWLGICYEEMNNENQAIQEYMNTIAFNLGNSLEAEARYRIARLYIKRGGYAQARHQLEKILHEYKDVPLTFPLNSVYEWLSKICFHLGEKQNAEHYSIMAQTNKPQQ
jgi:tetratricopeptide (TPR) repeat protein